MPESLLGMHEELKRAGRVSVAYFKHYGRGVQHRELDHTVWIVGTYLFEYSRGDVVRELLGQFFVYVVVINETGRVFKLLLTAAAWDETLQDYLFELFIGSVAREGQLADNRDSLAVLLYLSDKLTDVLVLQRKRVNL